MKHPRFRLPSLSATFLRSHSILDRVRPPLAGPRILAMLASLLCSIAPGAQGASLTTASNSFTFSLTPIEGPTDLRPESPFGINTAFHPDAPDLDARLAAMQNAGIKWGRQDFTWRRIERRRGEYDWAGYDALVDKCRAQGLQLFGNLTYHPDFYDMKSAEAVAAYAEFAKAAAQRYAGRIDCWQIWNEPNLGYLRGDVEHYARLLAAAGPAIHGANPRARVLALNMAFCDVLWASNVLQRVPPGAYDVVCFHPYRNPNAPEDRFDWWVQDQYVKRFHPELTTNYPLVRMSFLEQTDELLRTLRALGPGQPKPLWVTEICFNTHIHPYGVPELREADLLVRFYVQAIASRKIEKVFWWTLKDGGGQQFDAAEMVGLMRADLTPKYAYQAHAVMTRLLEGRRWVRNDAFGPEVFACIFTDEAKGEDTIVAWANKPYAYARINNTERGLIQYDVFGTQRVVTYNRQRTGFNPFVFGESPIYIVGPKGLKVNLRPDPGW
jgi:hypothetical protein